MKLTNRNNYPKALVRAVENDPYTKGGADYSITELLKPPRQAALQKLHAHEIEEDVEDRLWSLYGQIAHLILERANEEDLAEKRFFATIDVNGTFYKISGQTDSLSLTDDVLTDWKFVTAWKFKNGKANDPDWVAQLNMQLELLRQNGLNASKLQIVGLLRDWSKLEAKRAVESGAPDSYPQKPVQTVPIEVWSREKTLSFMRERIALHEKARSDYNNLPLCSKEERWADDPVWAVMKGSRAIRFGRCLTESSAKALQARNPGTRIEFRPSVSKRCEAYCSVNVFCDQYKSMKGEKNEVS